MEKEENVSLSLPKKQQEELNKRIKDLTVEVDAKKAAIKAASAMKENKGPVTDEKATEDLNKKIQYMESLIDLLTNVSKQTHENIKLSDQVVEGFSDIQNNRLVRKLIEDSTQDTDSQLSKIKLLYGKLIPLVRQIDKSWNPPKAPESITEAASNTAQNASEAAALKASGQEAVPDMIVEKSGEFCKPSANFSSIQQNFLNHLFTHSDKLLEEINGDVGNLPAGLSNIEELAKLKSDGTEETEKSNIGDNKLRYYRVAIGLSIASLMITFFLSGAKQLEAFNVSDYVLLMNILDKKINDSVICPVKPNSSFRRFLKVPENYSSDQGSKNMQEAAKQRAQMAKAQANQGPLGAFGIPSAMGGTPAPIILPEPGCIDLDVCQEEIDFLQVIGITGLETLPPDPDLKTDQILSIFIRDIFDKKCMKLTCGNQDDIMASISITEIQKVAQRILNEKTDLQTKLDKALQELEEAEKKIL